MFKKIRSAAQSAIVVKNAAEHVTDEIKAVKTHLEDHKEAYAAGGSMLVTGVTIGAAIAGRRQFAEAINKQKVVIRPIQIGMYNTIGNINTIVTPAGHRGNLIQIVETGEILASQNQAAKKLGCSVSKLRRHLEGAVENINGLHVDCLGENLAAR